MKRIVRKDSVIYVERHLLWSALYFAGTLLALVAMVAVRNDPDRSFLFVVFLGALVLGVLAFRDLFRARAFRIQENTGTLECFERTSPWSRTRTTVVLSDITVVLETQIYEHRAPSRYGAGGSTWVARVSRVLLTVKGQEPIVFMKEVRGTQGPQLAKALATDLGRPLEQVERQGGTPSSSGYGRR